MKTTQAIRNIRKFKKHQTHGIKGRMITDDYGNRYSVTNDPNAKVARRHTLSRAKKRADGLNYEDPLYNARKKSETGHAASVRRRRTLNNMSSPTTLQKYNTTYNKEKILYHAGRVKGSTDVATIQAKTLHKGKRKPKDFTK